LSVCPSVRPSDKQGRAGAVTLAFPGRYLLAAQGQGRAWQGGQGKHPPTGPVGGPQQQPVDLWPHLSLFARARATKKLRCLPILLFFFFTMNQFDWPIPQKK